MSLTDFLLHLANGGWWVMWPVMAFATYNTFKCLTDPSALGYEEGPQERTAAVFLWFITMLGGSAWIIGFW